jgi:hypothetical protein
MRKYPETDSGRPYPTVNFYAKYWESKRRLSSSLPLITHGFALENGIPGATVKITTKRRAENNPVGNCRGAAHLDVRSTWCAGIFSRTPLGFGWQFADGSCGKSRWTREELISKAYSAMVLDNTYHRIAFRSKLLNQWEETGRY